MLTGAHMPIIGDMQTRITIPPPIDEASINNPVPNVFHIVPDGSVVPVNYELREAEAMEDFPL